MLSIDNIRLHVSIIICTRDLAFVQAKQVVFVLFGTGHHASTSHLAGISEEEDSCWTSLIIVYQIIRIYRTRRRGRPIRGLLKTHMIWSMRILSVLLSSRFVNHHRLFIALPCQRFFFKSSDFA